jgi:DNA modification methylase
VSVRILVGNSLDVLKTLPDKSVQTCVTSPPYYGLRSYLPDGHEDKHLELGLEKTPQLYVEAMLKVFSEVKRVLRDDGTLWLNVGDSHASAWVCNRRSMIGAGSLENGKRENRPNRLTGDLKEKDLIGVPWMLAFALRADGWYLRSDIVWTKPNGMPESVRDRPTRSHEMVFLFSKSERYFYDTDTARTPPAPATETRLAQNVEQQEGSLRANGGTKSNGAMKAVQRKSLPETQAKLGAYRDKQREHSRRHAGFNERWDAAEESGDARTGANLRSVWWVSPAQYKGAHYAVMPTALAEICITAGSRKGDTVLDPFSGVGTTALVADRTGRHAIGIELNPTDAETSRERIHSDNPLFGDVA